MVRIAVARGRKKPYSRHDFLLSNMGGGAVSGSTLAVQKPDRGALAFGTRRDLILAKRFPQVNRALWQRPPSHFAHFIACLATFPQFFHKAGKKIIVIKKR